MGIFLALGGFVGTIVLLELNSLIESQHDMEKLTIVANIRAYPKGPASYYDDELVGTILSTTP